MIENRLPFICILLFFMAKYIHITNVEVLSLKAARTDLLDVTRAERRTTFYTPMQFCLSFLFVIWAFYFVQTCSATLLLSRAGWWPFSFDPQKIPDGSLCILL